MKADRSQPFLNKSNKVLLRPQRMSYAILFVSFLMLTACAVRDEYVMRNGDTGEQISCYTRPYSFEPSIMDYAVAAECIHRCEKYGFKKIGKNGPLESPNGPEELPENMHEFIPPQCSK